MIFGLSTKCAVKLHTNQDLLVRLQLWQ